MTTWEPDEATFRKYHANHDVGWRHEEGRLFTATCHDCDERYEAEGEQ